jgi:hypothetical protein
MSPAAVPGKVGTGALCAFAALALLAGLGAGSAHGERHQQGNVIVSLRGGFAPVKLPRHEPAPVKVHLEGSLATADGQTLPRVTEIELGLPVQGVINTRGLPTCPLSRLRDTTPKQALQVCEGALVGSGKIEADVLLPDQAPFRIHADLLAFNGKLGGQRAVFLHAFALKQLTVVVLPFLISHVNGRFGTKLAAALSPELGPWPHFARFDMTFARQFLYRGKRYSYISAACPIPPSLNTGYFSFAQSTYTLEDGSKVGTGITRSCHA